VFLQHSHCPEMTPPLSLQKRMGEDRDEPQVHRICSLNKEIITEKKGKNSSGHLSSLPHGAR
jgi:hypothetical protein